MVELSVMDTLVDAGLRFHLHAGTSKSPHPLTRPRWPNWPKGRRLGLHSLCAVAKLFSVEALKGVLDNAILGEPQGLLDLLLTLSRITLALPLDYTNDSLFCYSLHLTNGDPKDGHSQSQPQRPSPRGEEDN